MANSTILNSKIFASANGVSLVVCLLAAILMCGLKLYKKVVYRLAFYQVLSAVVFTSVSALQVMFINYNDSPNIYGRICIAIGFLVVYTQWMKLLFTMWVTFHLFCFAVLHKNLKNLEVLYVVTSLLVPALVAIIPLVTYTYGLNSGGDVCYIYANKSAALIERFVLWDGPAMFMLIAASITMLVMVIKLASHVYRRYKYEPITDGDQFTKALKQILPLAAFPILFFIFEIPVFTLHVYSINSTPNEGITIVAYVFISLWSMASGATILIHISVARICGRHLKPIKPVRVHGRTLDTNP